MSKYIPTMEKMVLRTKSLDVDDILKLQEEGLGAIEDEEARQLRADLGAIDAADEDLRKKLAAKFEAEHGVTEEAGRHLLTTYDARTIEKMVVKTRSLLAPEERLARVEEHVERLEKTLGEVAAMILRLTQR